MLSNKRTLALPVAILLGAVAVSACASTPRARAPQKVEARSAGDTSTSGGGGGFSSIASRGWVDVHVTIGASESVQVKCAEDLLASVHTRVENGGALVVETDDRWGIFRWGKDSYRDEAECTVEVQTAGTNLSSISSLGSGDVKVAGGTIKTPASGTFTLSSKGSGAVAIESLEAADVQAEIMGSGNVRAAGTAKSLRVRILGSGELDAHALKTETIHVRSSGSGDCRLFTSRKVDIESNGSGDIVVAGHPSEKNTKTIGSGSIRWE